MSRIVEYVIVAVLGMLSIVAVSAQAAFWSDHDVLPKLKAIVFLDDSIIFSTKELLPATHSLYGSNLNYRLDRTTNSVQQISSQQVTSITKDIKAEIIDLEKFPSNDVQKTSDGIAYKPHSVSCGYETGEPTTTLEINGTQFVALLDSCIGFYSMETTPSFFWVGTYGQADHGDYGASGLVLVDRYTGKVVDQIDAGELAIRAVVKDPYSDDIWAITDDRIVVVSSSRLHRRIFQFHHDFDSSTGLPGVQLAQGLHRSNILAIQANLLPRSQQLEFYRETRNIPDGLIADLSLYDFFMGQDEYLQYPLSKAFEVVIPFISIGLEHRPKKNSGWNRSWRQFACKLDHPTTKDLCETKRNPD